MLRNLVVFPDCIKTPMKMLNLVAHAKRHCAIHLACSESKILEGHAQYCCSMLHPA